MTKTENSINIDLLSSTLINIVKPTISEYFWERNAILMDKLEGNCCKQTAVIVANIMHTSISGLGYEVKAFEGNFVDMISANQIEYYHCWVYCRNVSDAEKSIMIDISRTNKPDVVAFRSSNSYDKTVKGYEFQYIKAKSELKYIEILEEEETYTGQKHLNSYKEIVKRISNQKLLKGK